MFKNKSAYSLVLFTASFLPLCLSAEKGAVAHRDDGPSSAGRFQAPNIKVDVPFVLIPVHVTTMLGRPVMDLKLKDFRLFDENVEQSIRTITWDEAPVSIGILFDCSGSMAAKMTQSAQAAAAFLRTANPQDEHFLVEFGDRANLSIPFTLSSGEIAARIARIRPFGRTAMYDAIHLALKQMMHAKNKRKAIVIFSDGGDNWSRKTLQGIRNSLAETDVQLYAIEILADTGKTKLTREVIAGPGILDALTYMAGGAHLSSDLSGLAAISEQVGNELRSQYLLGYAPIAGDRNGKYHRVKVAIDSVGKPPDLRVSYRRGYYDASN
jgi:Ca-activated chloride channel family protein